MLTYEPIRDLKTLREELKPLWKGPTPADDGQLLAELYPKKDVLAKLIATVEKKNPPSDLAQDLREFQGALTQPKRIVVPAYVIDSVKDALSNALARTIRLGQIPPDVTDAVTQLLTVAAPGYRSAASAIWPRTQATPETALKVVRDVERAQKILNDLKALPTAASQLGEKKLMEGVSSEA